MNKKIKKVLSDNGIFSINSEKFRYDNHENDNRIIFDFNYILAKERDHTSVKIIGYNEHPSIYERDDSIAVMFEDVQGREFWCHIPNDFFESQNIGRIFHIEELMNDFNEN